ncbi:P-loop containing nucleoside triphosphate hydrolase protein [Cryomyces antarcticus]
MTAALDELQLLLKLQDAAGSGQSALDLRLVNTEELLSQGEQQLFCLARAMLMEGNIVVLDECTGGVDIATEELIQQILRRPPFSDRTIIAIAHRLDTILDFDRVVVMNAGRIVENDNPRILIKTEGSLFRALVESQGAAQPQPANKRYQVGCSITR